MGKFKNLKKFRDLQIVSIFQLTVVLFTNIEIQPIVTQFDLKIIIFEISDLLIIFTMK